MKVCVLGAGAIGATLGAKLAASGHQVSLIARGAHLQAILEEGLQLIDQVGTASGTYHLPASSDPAEFKQPQDLIIVGLKSHSLGAMLPRIRPLLGAGTVVLPAINGLPWWYFQRCGGPRDGARLHSLDPHGVLQAAVDPERIIGCVVHMAAEAAGPGCIRHTAGRRLILGELDGSPSERLRSIASALTGAGFDIELSDQIRRDIWIKLIGNLSFNPVAALTGYRMDQICSDENVLEVIRAVLREGMAVAAQLGVDVGLTVDQRIDIARQLGTARISMLQDLEQRRPLELEAIVGAVIELGELTGVPVPGSRMLYALVRARSHALGIAAA